MLNKLNRSAPVAAVIYGCIFAFLLVCNILSLYIADDYCYLFSFADSRRIENVFQIVNSMRAHRYSMNGRLVVHTLVQAFGLLPLWVFDVVNAAMFVLQTALICKLARGGGRSNVMLIVVFCVLWLCTPLFGQVNLWQDGALNYLWSIVICLAFLIPFVHKFLYGSQVKTPLGKAAFLCLSFCMGAYSETASAAAIFMAFVFLTMSRVQRKEKTGALWIWSILIAFAGYVSIYLAPAQWREKAAERSFQVLLKNFLVAAERYWTLTGVLLCAFGVMLAGNFLIKADKKRIQMALVFFAGSLAANFIMTFSSYYAARSVIGSYAYLVTADAILLYPLLENVKFKKWLACASAVLALLTVPKIAVGMEDIGNTYQHMKDNEAYIYECRENGILDIEVPVFYAQTQFSEAYGLDYLNMENPATWPNDSMALYYGARSLIGVKPE